MRKSSLSFALSALLSLSPAAFAEELVLPHPEFKPGTPAYAASVNENFEALRTGVNDNLRTNSTNSEQITVNTGGIGANAGSITKVKADLGTHGHAPGSIQPQGTGSGLDADMLDGSDSVDFATSIHKHDSMYTPIGHTHPVGEIIGAINADTLDSLDSPDFANVSHSHTDLASTSHNHDEDYPVLNHAHEDYSENISEQEGRISELESYGDLSRVLGDITALQKTIAQLNSNIAELEKKLKDVSEKTE